jgi:hypothetical protein
MHDFTHEEMDEYLSKDLFIPGPGELATARVLRRTRDGDGVPCGCCNSNPILDTRQYEVEFIMDLEGQQYVVFKGIVDHQYFDHPRDTTYVDEAGNHLPTASTLGWELCVQWADGTSIWLPLADLRESNPMEGAEYAVS